MSYQSFISAILQSKYYTQSKEWIKDFIHKTPIRPSIMDSYSQIFLVCPNKQICACPFSHKFKKVQTNEDSERFDLFESNEKHSIECQDSRKGKKSPQKIHVFENQQKSSNLIHSIDIQSTVETSVNSPMSKQSIINIVKNNSITQNIQKKLYTEGKPFFKPDEFPLLKKQLELQSKGLLSKSTEFQDEPNANLIKKIQFHCKFEGSCPYDAVLKTCPSELPARLFYQNKRTFSLEIVNPNHLPQCILEEEVINYNQNTMKIDREIDLLTKIIQINEEKLKPKVKLNVFQEILRKLAQQMGEEEDFIYHGLQRKMNKRAIKKYFDNCVAKVRSRIFPEVKNPRTSLSIHYESGSKKDQDYVCK